MTAPRAFVTGWPISHSRSPLIHGFWLDRYGIEGEYVREAVPPDGVAVFFAGFQEQGFVGGNVTLPHKEAAFRACADVTDQARRLAAANTLWIENDRLWGDNTDAYGFAANLDELAPDWRSGSTGLVLGAGGAARSVLAALLEAGYRSIVVLNRTVERAEAMAAMFAGPVAAAPLDEAARHLPRADLVVNATSAGIGGSAPLDLDWDLAKADTIATDLVYVPLRTPFLEGAAGRGIRTVDGLGMLLHQAVPGFHRWFGLRPEVTPELRARIVADLPGIRHAGAWTDRLDRHGKEHDRGHVRPAGRSRPRCRRGGPPLTRGRAVPGRRGVARCGSSQEKSTAAFWRGRLSAMSAALAESGRDCFSPARARKRG
jgi:shikimate dehydrogenase